MEINCPVRCALEALIPDEILHTLKLFNQLVGYA